jgi:hypothetical protein
LRKNLLVAPAPAWPPPFGHGQQTQGKPGAGQQLPPSPEYLPGRHVKAGFFAKLYFSFHNFHLLAESVSGGFRCAIEALRETRRVRVGKT